MKRFCLSGLIALVALDGCTDKQEIGSRPGPIPYAKAPLIRSAVEPPVVERLPVEFKPSVQPLSLPLKPEEVINLERDVRQKQFLADPDGVVAALLRDGMAVGKASQSFDLFHKAYQQLARDQMPVMVTSDSLLHLYHLFFGEVLKAIEVQRLSPMLAALLEGLYVEVARASLHAGPELVEPFVNELAYLAVAIKLLSPEFAPHPQVQGRVAADLLAIEAHKGLTYSHTLSSAICIESMGNRGRCYHEDFSQYVPRGHYTQSEALKRYFKAAMWLGRIGHRFKHPDEVRQSAILVSAFKQASCSYQDRQLPAVELINRIDRVLLFFIGASDDLTLFEVDPALVSAIGGKDLNGLGDADIMAGLQKSLRQLRAPKILSGAVEAVGETAEATVKQETQGVRLLGQRFAPDSEMLGRLVYEFVGPDPGHPGYAEIVQKILHTRTPDGSPPCVLTAAELLALHELDCGRSSQSQWRCICENAKQWDADCRRDDGCRRSHPEEKNLAYGQVCRLMPSGLDVAAVLGSDLAKEFTRPSERYCGFLEQRSGLTQQWARELDATPETLYLSWLGMLRPLLAPVGQGYPTWMQGRSYQKKALRTALASWAELRHDTILYVKQSYTMHLIKAESAAAPMLVAAKFYGTVEPLPELLRSLHRLTAQTRTMLASLEVLPKEVEGSLSSAEQLFLQLLEIAGLQLTEKPLSVAQVDFINGIGDTFERMIGDLTKAFTPPSGTIPEGATASGTSVEGKDDAFKTTIVADVHTDLNTERVLQEGLGPIEWILVINRTSDGALSVSVGPVFSYFEFTHKLSDRLTNEKWRELLGSDPVPAPPWWSEERPIANGHQLPCTAVTPGCDENQ